MIHQQRITTLILFLLITVISGIAQVKIFGKITDSDNKPIEFATVRIEGTAIGATTGLDGSYSISSAERDTISVIFTCIGYKEQKQTLIKASGSVNLNVRLFKTTKELQAVEVTEYKKQTSGIRMPCGLLPTFQAMASNRCYQQWQAFHPKMR